MSHLFPGIAVGMPVSDANEIKDMETQTFRRSIMQVCKRVIDKRDSEGIESLAMYVYPPDIHSEKRLPSHVMDIISK